MFIWYWARQWVSQLLAHLFVTSVSRHTVRDIAAEDRLEVRLYSGELLVRSMPLPVQRLEFDGHAYFVCVSDREFVYVAEEAIELTNLTITYPAAILAILPSFRECQLNKHDFPIRLKPGGSFTAPFPYWHQVLHVY